MTVQKPTGVDASLALVCNIPESRRGERRITALSVVEQAAAVREVEAGVALVFDGSADMARMVTEFAIAERDCCAQFTHVITFAPHGGDIELRVTASGAFIQPLKDLYLGLAAEQRESSD